MFGRMDLCLSEAKGINVYTYNSPTKLVPRFSGNTT